MNKSQEDDLLTYDKVQIVTDGHFAFLASGYSLSVFISVCGILRSKSQFIKHMAFISAHFQPSVYQFSR